MQRPRNTVRNTSRYPDNEVRALVHDALRDVEASGVAVVVHDRRGASDHPTGHYREWWRPSKGETRPQIRVGLPRTYPQVYFPYERRDAPPTFTVATWQEALVAIVAHEGLHHVQAGARRGPRFVESACDWQAYRAVQRFRGAKGSA